MTVQQIDYVYQVLLPVGIVDGKERSLPVRYTVVDGVYWFEPHNYVKWLTGKALVSSCMHSMFVL